MPDPTVRTPDGELSDPKNVSIFITERRFGGVGAPGGRENVPDIHTRFSANIKKSVFLAFYVGYIPNFPAKILKAGELTCDFRAEVES